MADTIKAIQRQIVTKLEAGEDISDLTKRLAAERAKIAAQAEVEQLKKIADERKALKDKAEQVKAKIQSQGEAIDTLLRARDSIVEALLPIVDKASELPDLQDKCFAGFHDAMQAGSITRMAGGFLPADLTIPMLQLGKGDQVVYDVSKRALMYLNYAYGLLANLQKIETKPARLPIDPELDLGDNHSGAAGVNCLVCSHPEAEAINKQLKEGRPLRDIEAQFKVSRSSLSRHKNRCLNLGAIRVEQESSAASSNQTFFEG